MLKIVANTKILWQILKTRKKSMPCHISNVTRDSSSHVRVSRVTKKSVNRIVGEKIKSELLREHHIDLPSYYSDAQPSQSQCLLSPNSHAVQNSCHLHCGVRA